VKPANRAGGLGKGVVVLDEFDVDTGVGELPAVIGLDKKSALIREFFRADQFDLSQSQLLNVEGHRV
jgi:hypothetical protein